MATRVGLDGRALANINRNRGIGRYTASLVEALATARDGYELVLFGYGDGPEPGLIDPGAMGTVEWREIPTSGDITFYGGPRNHLLFARAVKESGVALFHGIDHNMTPLLKCRSIVTVHDLIPLVLRGPYLGPKSWLWLRAHRAACMRAGMVVAVSEATRDDLERVWKIPGEKIAVVHEGVAERYRPVEDEALLEDVLGKYEITRPYFLYLGGFDPRKNIDIMLLGFKRFGVSGGRGTMVLCGDTAGYEGYFQDAVAEIGLGESVLLPGFIADEDLPALYSGALALVFVSIYEGFGLPLLEAMACGAPVLASNVSSIPWVAGDAALLVDPLDPAAIAGGLELLAGEGTARSGLVRKGLARSSLFTWDKAAGRVLELYGRVLGGAAG